MDVPDVVRNRLDSLALDPYALQAPNFIPDDLVYHEPHHPVHEAATGVWSVPDGEFNFSLIGQISAHHTFLGEYGDLLSLCDGPASVPFSSMLRAKWKIGLVLPSTSGSTVAGDTLHRQGEMLRRIEQNCYAVSPLKSGTMRGSSFVHRTAHGDRVSVYSANIYRLDLVLSEGDVEGAEWKDSQHFFRDAVDERKDITVVRPLDLHAADGSRVDIGDAPGVFTAGSWVEVYCTLKMWDTSDLPMRPRRGPRRPPVRSFQVIFDAAQWLCSGRLNEPPRTDAPPRRLIKRSFSAISTNSALARPAKVAKPVANQTGIEDTVMQ